MIIFRGDSCCAPSDTLSSTLQESFFCIIAIMKVKMKVRFTLSNITSI